MGADDPPPRKTGWPTTTTLASVCGPRHSDPVSPRASLLGPLALLLALTAQLTGLVHLGVVRHERCAEHGELIEAAHDDDHDDGDPGEQRGWHAAGSDDDDDHCDLAFRVAVSVAVFAAVAHDLEVGVVGVDLQPGVRAAEAIRALDVLTVAPKTSPPTA